MYGDYSEFDGEPGYPPDAPVFDDYGYPLNRAAWEQVMDPCAPRRPTGFEDQGE